MVRDFRRVIEINGHRFDKSVLTCWNEGQPESWSIDFPTVMWMLNLIADGKIDARTARSELHRMTLWESGCCGVCDRALAYYGEARSRHKYISQRWHLRQGGLDKAEYPYIVNNGKIHTLDCTIPPSPRPPWFPENLHKFAVLLDGCGEDLESFFNYIHDHLSRGAKRVSVYEVQNQIARLGASSVRSKCCQKCRPSLPDLGPNADALQPVCWGWSVDPAVLEKLRSEVSPDSVVDVHILPEQIADFAILERWHNGRCAICGEVPIRRKLVRDHDHESGVIRGLLCNSCNTTESRSTSPLFANYRQHPPARILGVEVLYLPFGFQPGKGHLGSSAS